MNEFERICWWLLKWGKKHTFECVWLYCCCWHDTDQFDAFMIHNWKKKWEKKSVQYAYSRTVWAQVFTLCIVHVCIASIYVSVGGESYASINISSQSSPMNRSHPSEVFFAICIAQSLKPYFDIYTRRCATHTPEHAHETEFEGGFLFLLHIAN